MRTRHFTFGIALLFLTSFVGAVNAKTIHTHCTGAGTSASGVETNIDTDGDGVSATFDQGLQNCNTGRSFFQEENEWIHQPTVTTCPAGTTDEFHIDSTHGQNRGVATDERTGDQLFFKTTSSTLCGNFSTFPFTFTTSVQYEIIGGTGKTAGATGTGESHASGSSLAAGCKGGCPGPFGDFGQFTFTSDSTVNLPHGGHDKED
jgi:hypothetical protein